MQLLLLNVWLFLLALSSSYCCSLYWMRLLSLFRSLWICKMFFLDLVCGRLYPMPRFSVLMIVSGSSWFEWFSNLLVVVLIKWRLGCYFILVVGVICFFGLSSVVDVSSFLSMLPDIGLRRAFNDSLLVFKSTSSGDARCLFGVVFSEV
jgi:hypothetical protein